ncbi:MAG TPA: hypothetical protein PKD37_02780 [Oligoflexia bacterium]|nr:hypothetical protein [Oligoflexia bacterium]HMP26891.1 hypothetical protein [Oligoflexia bacterium]
MKKFVLFLPLVCLLAGRVFAEDLDTIFDKVKKYAAAGNYQKAIAELGWAKQELEKKNLSKLESFFPNELGDLRGGKIEANAALGISNIERTYQGAGYSVKVSLTGFGGGAAGAGNPLAGLASLGQMAAMFGGSQAGEESFRVGDLTARGEKKGSRAEITVFTQSGGIMKFETDKADKYDQMKELAKKFDYAALDNYLRGSSNS